MQTIICIIKSIVNTLKRLTWDIYHLRISTMMSSIQSLAQHSKTLLFDEYYIASNMVKRWQYTKCWITVKFQCNIHRQFCSSEIRLVSHRNSFKMKSLIQTLCSYNFYIIQLKKANCEIISLEYVLVYFTLIIQASF